MTVAVSGMDHCGCEWREHCGSVSGMNDRLCVSGMNDCGCVSGMNDSRCEWHE